MRMARILRRLSLLLVLLAAAHVLLARWGRAPEPVTPRLTPLTDPRTVTSFAVRTASGPSFRLARKGVDWVFETPFAAAADSRAVMRFLDTVAFATPEDELSDAELLRRGRTPADFGLEQPRLTIEIGDVPVLRFGSLTPSAKGVYAEIVGGDSVVVFPSNILAQIDCPADNFRRRTVMDDVVARTVGFSVKAAQEQLLEFSFDGQAWSSTRGRAASTRLHDYLVQLAAAEARNIVWPSEGNAAPATASLLAAYGLDSGNALTLTLKCLDGTDRQLVFGHKAGEGLVYALVQDGSAIVTVDAALAEPVAAAATAFIDSRLFPFEPRAVRRFAVASGSVDCILERAESDGWRLVAPIQAPADTAFAEAVLARLLSLSSAAVVTNGVFVSVQTNAAIACVSPDAVLQGHPLESFRARHVISLLPNQVRRLVRTVVTPDAGTNVTSVTFDSERRLWNVERAQGASRAQQDHVIRILDAVAPLTAQRVVKLQPSAADLAAYGLDAPALLLSFDIESGSVPRRNLVIGAPTKGGRFATIGAADAVFVLPEDVCRTLLLPLTAAEN